MTDIIMAFIDDLRKEGLVEDIDFLRGASGFMYQQRIDLEAEEVMGEQDNMNDPPSGKPIGRVRENANRKAGLVRSR